MREHWERKKYRKRNILSASVAEKLDDILAMPGGGGQEGGGPGY